MTKVYMVLPIETLTMEEATEEQSRIGQLLADKLDEVDIAVVNVALRHKEQDFPLHTLGMNLAFMEDVDLVFFPKGWKDSRFGRVMQQIAMAYGKMHIYEDNLE